MKKITYNLIFFLLSFLLIPLVNSNWDDYNSVPYEARISSPYNVEVNLKNISCNSSSFVSWDIFDVLNFQWTSWINCVKNWTHVTCNKTESTYMWWTIDWTLLAVWTYDDILSELWVEQNIIDQISWDYINVFSFYMNIMMTSNGGSINNWERIYDFSDFWPFIINLDYRDISKCPPSWISWDFFVSPNSWSSPLDVSFSGSFSGWDPTSYEYLYTFWDGSTGSILNTNHVYTSYTPSEDFYVSLNVKDKNWNTYNWEKVINVTNTWALDVDITASPDFWITPLPVNFNSNVTGWNWIYTYRWYISWIEVWNNHELDYTFYNYDILIKYYLVELIVEDSDWRVGRAEKSIAVAQEQDSWDAYPAILSYVHFNGCSYEWLTNGYTCYASWAIDFSLRLSSLWRRSDLTPIWISQLTLNINNWANTWWLSSTYKNIAVNDTSIHYVKMISELFKQPWDYTLEFFWKWDVLDPLTWTNLYNLKLHIIPNNDFETVWTASSSSDYIFVNSGSINICQDIEDSYWNIINKDYALTSNKVQNNLWVSLNVSNVSFNNSTFCFDVWSSVPAFWVDFDALVPEHVQRTSLLANWNDKILDLDWTYDFYKPNILGDILANCTQEWLPNEYTCYASWAIDFSVNLSSVWDFWDWSPWISQLQLNINNWANTGWLSSIDKNVSISDESNHNVVIESDLFKQAWDYTLEFVWKWDISNSLTWTDIYDIKLHIIPNNDFSFSWLPQSSGDVYANWTSYINICQDIVDSYWNTINKDYSLNDDKVVSLVNLYSDQINNTWNALIVDNVTFNNSAFCFDVASVVPVNDLEFKIYVPEHTESTLLNMNNSYKEFILNWSFNFTNPIIYSFKLSNNSWSTWTALPEVWRNQMYKLELINTWWLASYHNWALNISESTVQNEIHWHTWSTFDHIDNSFDSNMDSNYVWFNWFVESAVDIPSDPHIITKDLVISYDVLWKFVRYKLDDTWIYWKKRLWMRAYWIVNWIWLPSASWNIEGSWSLDKSKLRLAINKNAYNLIKWMSNWQEANWVKYVNWDITIWWDLSYETLIVKDWNVIIDSDLNLSKKKLWIIVLYDDFNIDTDNWKWNIYINSDVTEINAIMYADWWLISSNIYWVPYLSDTFTRMNDLQKQLIMNWALFTRNTIWWAIMNLDDKYILPLWDETINLDKAILYDLNYIRTWNIWCEDLDLDTFCDKYMNYFIVIYDSRLQSDPPKWFSY